jgi:ribosome-binding factor A
VALTTVTDAQLSPDHRYARVFVSIYGDQAERRATLAALNKAAGFVRKQLGARLRLRHSPEVTFCFDQSVEQGARIEEVLAEVKKEMPDPGAPDGGD